MIGLLAAHEILLKKQALTNAVLPSLHRLAQGEEVEVEADSVSDQKEGQEAETTER